VSQNAVTVTTYMYFMRTSNASVPPGALYTRPSIGDISDARIDCKISMTAARWSSYRLVKPVSLLCLCNVLEPVLVVGSPRPQSRRRLWCGNVRIQRDICQRCPKSMVVR
jgi:hypothetical protein